MSKLNSALTLSVRGWRLFPLTPNSKMPTKAMTGWEQTATDDPDQVSAWWTYYPHNNIGLATGPSDLVVLDFDAAKNPNETSGIENFRAAYPDKKLPATFTVKTPGGGWHLYYSAGGNAYRNTAGKLATKVDTRAQGGYVVAPGSHVNGGLYEIAANTPVAMLPDWIATDLLKEAGIRPETVRPKGAVTQYAAAAMRHEVAAVSSMTEGGRNHATNRAAWNLSRFVAKGELHSDDVADALINAAMLAGLSTREAQNAVNSGLTRGIKHFRMKS